MEEIIKMDKDGYNQYLREIEKLDEKLKKLRKYKGTEAIFLGDTWHDNPTLYQTENEERSIMFHIKDMRDKLKNIEIVEKTDNGELIDIGDTVVVDMIFGPGDTEEQIFTLIGGSPDFSLEIAQVSINSPLGSAVYQKRVGDKVTYTIQNTLINVEIKQKLNLEPTNNENVKKLVDK